MPFITTKISGSLTEEQEIRLVSGLGKAIECVPGKTQESLMLSFEDNCHLYLRGDGSQPMAYVTVAVFGNPFHWGYEQLSLTIAQLFQETMSIDQTRVYIKYEDIPSWSVGGWTFGRVEAT
ncbi:hypothetical protein CO662_35615 [Rhizobium anhuiense]|uniref:Tautomerase family protein n=1 Tax=Rhizobium anhuiense TaxID=1184720 RepID=A0ABX4IXK4_9HYPH|nr:phenylpyruvate tautomerase MIF-related protein [Rhizobium anhuiense]PDS41174.1 hypothetical protein CO668_29935 [Rhizobium anhuiense]PDS46411.1 hypothetical protein CO662_35615 [Rhizobium anhuiense]